MKSMTVNKAQQGMSLIEVMIAVFVLAIGMLGMAALLTSSKQAGYEAVQRGIAVGLAQDMLGRIRSNPQQLADYNGAAVGGAAPSMTAVDCSASCDTASMVKYDLYQWEQALIGAAEVGATGNNVGGLVSPTGCISVTADTTTTTAKASVVTVAIAWRGMQILSNPTTSTCGEGSGLYGDNDSQRQVLVVQTYVAELDIPK